MIHVQLNPERILMTELETLNDMIKDISIKRFGHAVREVFGGMPPERDRKVYLCGFKAVLWPEFDVYLWFRSLFGWPIDYQYFPIVTLRQLVEQKELELLIRATRLIEKQSVRTPTEFVQLCTDFLQLFNLSFASDCSSVSRQKPYRKRDLQDALKLYLY